jgi:uncharacterized protein
MVSRILPEPDETSAFYWNAATRGVLAILRCRGCSRWVHPPRLPCPRCGAGEAVPEAVSGRGVVHAVTTSHHRSTGRSSPFVLALVALEEDPEARLLAEILDVEPADVAIGLAVEVTFEDVGEGVRLPQFRPRG